MLSRMRGQELIDYAARTLTARILDDSNPRQYIRFAV